MPLDRNGINIIQGGMAAWDTSVCGSEPPEGGPYSDCWCTLPPGHGGGFCECGPCTNRYGTSPWPTPTEAA